MDKRLSNEYIKNILYILARKNTPITSTQLIKFLGEEVSQEKNFGEKGAQKKGKNYVYEQLKFLYPDKYEFNKRTIIFNLNTLLDSPSEHDIQILIEKLSNIFETNDTIYNNQDRKNRKGSKGKNSQKLQWQKVENTNDDIKSRFLIWKDWLFEYLYTERMIVIRNSLNFRQFIIGWTSIENEEDYESGYIWYFNDLHNIKLRLEKKIRLVYDRLGNIHFHIEKPNGKNTTKFVDVFLKDNIGNRDSELKCHYHNLIEKGNRLEEVKRRFYGIYHFPLYKTTSNKIRNELHNIIKDSRNWKYQINLKGFFLYLYLEESKITPLEEYYKRKYSKESTFYKLKKTKRLEKIHEEEKIKTLREIKKTKQDIKKLLSTPLIQKLCPFLLYNDEFQKVGFKPEQVLLYISKEIIPQIDYYERGIFKLYAGPGMITYSEYLSGHSNSKSQLDEYFLWKAWERYYYEIEKFFITRYHIENEIQFLIAGRANKKIYEKLLKYRLYTGIMLQKMVNFEAKSIANTYAKTYDDYREYFTNENDCASPDEFNKNFSLMIHRYLVISSFLRVILFHYQN